MKRALISVDFDYFVREEFKWDWGHSENKLFLEAMWLCRYASPSIDIERETDPRVHADFMPEELLMQLMVKGFMPSRNCELATAESHSVIGEFVGRRKFDVYVNLDAHHDMYKEPPPVDCGNWWIPIYDSNPEARHIQIFPQWRELMELEKPLRPIEQVLWKDLNLGQEVFVDAVFLCRSGCWVPPHLDPLFNQMVTRFNPKLKMPERKIDKREISKERKRMQAFMEVQHKMKPEER